MQDNTTNTNKGLQENLEGEVNTIQVETQLSTDVLDITPSTEVLEDTLKNVTG